MRQVSFLLISVSIAMLAGCGGASDKSDGTIRLALNWYPDAQHGGFYSAVINGYYEDEGLDVEIVPGGPNVPVIEKVAQGRVEFGVSNADQILQKRNQGAKVVALMAPLQNSPRCIMVHEESGIESFDELQNVTLALGPGRAFAEYMKRRTTLDGVRVVNYSGTVTRFLTDQDFAQQAYVFSEPFVAEQAGAKTRCLMISELGYSPYTSCLFAEEEYIASNSELVQRFVRATIKGWQKYLEDPEPVNRAIHEANPEMDMDSLKFAAEAIRVLCLTEGMTVDELGSMSDERWERLVEQLQEIEFLPAGTTATGAYRLDFIPQPAAKADPATDP